MSGHSFCRGGASFAFQEGVPDILNQRQGDWESACYSEYIALSCDRAITTTQDVLRLFDANSGTASPTTIVVAGAPMDHVDALALGSTAVW